MDVTITRTGETKGKRLFVLKFPVNQVSLIKTVCFLIIIFSILFGDSYTDRDSCSF